MAQNLQLDPVARDYVTKNGSPISSDRILEAAYYAMKIPQGGWLYGGIDQGSLLFTLAGRKRTSSIEQQFSAFTQAALKSQLIDTSKALATAVKNLQATRTGSSNQVEIIPSNTQISNQLNFSPV